MKPNVYQYFRQERISYGFPVNEAVARELEKVDHNRIFVIATKSLNRKTEVVSSLVKSLGNRFCGLFDEVEPHVPRPMAVNATKAAREAKADMLISIGGGSAVDTGKMIQICLAEGITDPGELDRFTVKTDDAGRTVVPVIKTPPLRQIVVPTTLSGGEWSHTTGATDPVRHNKDIYIQDDLAAPAVIYDASATVSTPEWLWMSSGMRAVDHAIGSITTANPNPLTDATTPAGLKRLTAAMRAVKANPDDLEARLNCQLGVWLSSTGMMRMQYGASHGLSWHLSAVADVPHGHCSCVLLPATLRYNEPANSEQQKIVSECLGSPGMPAADAVLALINELELPSRLRDVGIKREHFQKIADDSMHNLLVRNNPRKIDKPEQVLEILEMAW
ncbi:MAG: iron-containing alcohol dehydrogenase [Flavobacteriaceae bacterium]